MKRLIKYLIADVVSLILVIIAFVMLTGWFTVGTDVTPFICGVLIIYILGTKYDMSRLLEKMYLYLTPQMLKALGLPESDKSIKRKYAFIEIAAIIIMAAGSLFMLWMLIKTFIIGN